MSNEWLQLVRRVQALAQSGIRYAKDPFDTERYEELRSISVKMAGMLSEGTPEVIKGLFASGKGFETPKIDVRSVILREKTILMVHEKMDGCWSLPGGFADVNDAPSRVAEKEVWEESGLHVKANKLIAVLDTNQHGFPPLENHFYKLIFLCEEVSGELKAGLETQQVAFFQWDALPELSEKRNSRPLMHMIEQWSKEGFKETYFD